MSDLATLAAKLSDLADQIRRGYAVAPAELEKIAAALAPHSLRIDEVPPAVQYQALSPETVQAIADVLARAVAAQVHSHADRERCGPGCPAHRVAAQVAEIGPYFATWEQLAESHKAACIAAENEVARLTKRVQDCGRNYNELAGRLRRAREWGQQQESRAVKAERLVRRNALGEDDAALAREATARRDALAPVLALCDNNYGSTKHDLVRDIRALEHSDSAADAAVNAVRAVESPDQPEGEAEPESPPRA